MEYEYAKKGGYKGSFSEFMSNVKRKPAVTGGEEKPHKKISRADKIQRMAKQNVAMQFGQIGVKYNSLTDEWKYPEGVDQNTINEAYLAEVDRLSKEFGVEPPQKKEKKSVTSLKKGDLRKEVSGLGSSSKAVSHLMATYGYNKQQAKDIVAEGLKEGAIK